MSIFFNLGLLGFFKYFNFFIDSWVDLMAGMGFPITYVWTLNIILPVGISFYTFQTMSYSLDIYNKKLKPTKDFFCFAAFVSFFPQLVAGPIERASNLLPQILHKRTFNYDHAIIGMRLILWGLFKKVVIADSLAPIVNDIFAHHDQYHGGILVLGAVFFGFQIYGDFSGYSDIAIGVAKLFGIHLMTNFNFPYFSRNIGEFWRRWHISLSTWFRDYLYIPLGGSKVSKPIALRNIFIIFLVSGFWHGANWTFIAWGFYHTVLFIPAFINKTNRKYLKISTDHFLPRPFEILNILLTFLLVTIGWVFFRADNLFIAFDYLKRIIITFDIPTLYFLKYLFPCGIIFILDWLKYKKIEFQNWTVVDSLTFLIIIYFSLIQNKSPFIYFNF
ncbi:MBOAT family O-acyltransferase [Membranihabitans marinus]|uniref:MBOAT family O-acyltransferase n=1 Tax=Membranihabitans marinus TaxID=1227546 RepID=UPI001F1A5BAC|nr:MBOAT family O-acyltransferase [Membranihabitans marinus]